MQKWIYIMMFDGLDLSHYVWDVMTFLREKLDKPLT